MIVDSSALVAVVRNEGDAETFSRALEKATAVQISAASFLEASIVLGPALRETLDQIIHAADAEIVAFDETQAREARAAYVTHGKGSGSPARLNFGDCFSYALAKTTGEALLFKGDGFTHTDATPALS